MHKGLQVLLLRYMIFNRRGYIKVNLVERPGKPGFYLERTIDFTASKTVPALVITGSSFGHPAAATRSYDVTEVRTAGACCIRRSAVTCSRACASSPSTADSSSGGREWRRVAEHGAR